MSADDFYTPTDIDSLRMENELLAHEVRFLKSSRPEWQLKEQLEKRDLKIQQLERQVRHLEELRRKLDDRNKQLAEKENEVAGLTQQVAKRTHQLAKLRGSSL